MGTGVRLAVGLGLGLSLAALGQPQPPAATDPALPSVSPEGASAATVPAADAPVPAAQNAKAAPIKAAPIIAPDGPAWHELSSRQKQALAPLAPSWNGMSEPHRRKWIALSRNFANLSPEEQAKLHAHMAEWGALSPQQRSQARFNFAVSKRLTHAEKQDQWEAYQALSPEERQKLRRRVPKLPAGAAPALRPPPPQKLVRVPSVVPPGQKARPTITFAPDQVNPRTLLPQGPPWVAARP